MDAARTLAADFVQPDLILLGVLAIKALTVDLEQNQTTCSGHANGTVSTPTLFCVMANGGASTCSARFALGTSVTLTPTTVGDSSFEGFSGACSGQTCAVTMNADADVTATFCSLMH